MCLNSDHVLMCKNVAKMTQMRHDIAVAAVRRVICRGSCPSVWSPPTAPPGPAAATACAAAAAHTTGRAGTAGTASRAAAEGRPRSAPWRHHGCLAMMSQGGQIVIVDAVAHRSTGLPPCWQPSCRCCCQAGWGRKGPGLSGVRRHWPVRIRALCARVV